MSVDVSTTLISCVVDSIFSTMLDVPVRAIDCDVPVLKDKVTSSVYLEGPWNGAVSLICSRAHACQLASRFMGVDPPAEVDDDVRDALGELANMIGGNIKSCLGPEMQLSLPSVIDGSDYEIRVCGSEVRDHIRFESPDGEFWICIVAKTGSSRLLGGESKPAALLM
jgi:chemotaxis protein CheX